MQNRAARIVALSVIVLMFVPALASAQKGSNGNPGVLPPNGSAYGMTYGEWSARHWQWLYSIPVTGHPLFQDGTVDLSIDQPAGPVWFLGGSFTTIQSGTVFTATADRTGVVPPGKALFFPIIDSEDSFLEDPAATTVADLRASAAAAIDHMTSVSCEVDGVSLKNLEAYRVQSPAFTLGPLPADNLLGAPAGTMTTSVSDGVFVMLAPLPVGKHTIHFAGEVVFTQAIDGFDFTFALDITYHLTVKPVGK